LIFSTGISILEQLVSNNPRFFPRLVDNFLDERQEDSLIVHKEFDVYSNFLFISIARLCMTRYTDPALVGRFNRTIVGASNMARPDPQVGRVGVVRIGSNINRFKISMAMGNNSMRWDN
jgi:hypothetical protein